jgi:hypothetical protein
VLEGQNLLVGNLEDYNARATKKFATFSESFTRMMVSGTMVVSPNRFVKMLCKKRLFSIVFVGISCAAPSQGWEKCLPSLLWGRRDA